MLPTGKTVAVSLDRILFATDFSPGSEKAGGLVKAIAQNCRSTVELVHVVDLSAASQAPDARSSSDLSRKIGREMLERAREQFSSAGVQAETILCEGPEPAKAILEVARERKVDLIASGTRGQSGLARMALGSVTEQLIHHADCPVLTIGPNVNSPTATGKFQRIVCATDFSLETAMAVQLARPLAQASGTRMFLCHVLPKPEGGRSVDTQELVEKFRANLQRLIPDIARAWCEPECVVDHGYAADGILLLARRVKADLIIMGARRVSHWFANPEAGIAYDIIRSGDCPVLTVRG